MFIENKYKKWYDSIINNAKNRTLSGYFERHHIVPKSLGGNNDTSNIVNLTAREHFVAHILLTKFTEGRNRQKMSFAIKCFSMKSKFHSERYFNSRLYESLKVNCSEYTSVLHLNKIVSKETRDKISKARKGQPSPFKGKTHSDETKRKMSDSQKGHSRNTPNTVEKILDSRSWYSHSDETKKKISESNKGKTVVHTKESKRKISESLKGRVSPMKGKQAWNKGKTHSDETKARLSKAANNRARVECPHCGKSVTPGNFSRWHGDNCKLATF